TKPIFQYLIRQLTILSFGKIVSIAYLNNHFLLRCCFLASFNMLIIIFYFSVIFRLLIIILLLCISKLLFMNISNVFLDLVFIFFRTLIFNMSIFLFFSRSEVQTSEL